MMTRERHGRLLAAFCLLLAAALNCAFAVEEPAPEQETDPDIEFAVRLERGFQKLAKRVAPSVVSLEINIKPGNWMEELRRMSEQQNTPMPERKFEGSGVIVDKNGLIITNEHVVRGAERINVKMSDGRSFTAEVCGSDPRSDLAMIKLVGKNVPTDLPCATFADSDKVSVGQWAVAVGNPFGLSNTLTVGVVSARGRSMPAHSFSGDVFYGNLIQTDAAINPGNSGGPLFDIRGRLIGINTMIFSKSGISQGFGFAIPSNHLQKRISYLKAGREVEYGWLGVRLGDLRPGQNEFNVPENKGVRVEGVIPNTPADRAGLERGMVILNFDEQRISNSQELIGAVNETPVGQVVRLKAMDRAGKLAQFSVRISKRNSDFVRQASGLNLDDDADLDLDQDEELKAADAGVKKTVMLWRGMLLKELKPDDVKKRGGSLEVMRVKKGSPADRAGLYEGAIITELKHGANPAIQKFNSLEEFRQITSLITESAAIYVPLDGYVTIENK